MFATPSLYTIYGQPPRLDGADRRRHLAVGRVARRRRRARGGAPPGPPDDRAHERRGLAARAARPTRVLPLEAGEERAVAATKTYLNSLGAVALLFAAIGDDERRAHGARADAGAARGADRALVRRSRRRSTEYVVREPARPSSRAASTTAPAFEIALKIRELSGLVVEAYSPADLHARADRGHPPGLAGGGRSPRRARRTRASPTCVPALEEREARACSPSPTCRQLLERAHTPLPLVPGVPEWLSPLAAVIPGQVTAMRLARAARPRRRHARRAAASTHA